jgi:hypothetical protein
MNLLSVAPDEHSRRDLNDVFTTILQDIAPDEIPMLATVEDLAPGAVPPVTQSASGLGRVRRRGFPGAMEGGLVCLHLVAGTLALLDSYVKRKERREQKELEYSISEEWQKALIQAGMPQELARQIPVKFSADMIRFITTQRFPQVDARDNSR